MVNVQPDPFRDLVFDIRPIAPEPNERQRSQPPPQSGRFAIRMPKPPPILEDETLDAWFR